MFIKEWLDKIKETPTANKSSSGIRRGGELVENCLKSIQLSKQFQNSNFYTSYFTLLSEQIGHIFSDRIQKAEQGLYDGPVAHEKQLVSIVLSIVEQNGLLFTVINLWISYCEFNFKSIIDRFDNNEQLKSQQIIGFFHRQFFLLCLFLSRICLFLYEQTLTINADFTEHDLFVLIRNSVTACPKWPLIHNYIIKNVSPDRQNQFSEQNVRDNMTDLETLCKISQVPIAFIDSRDLLKKFYREHILESKMKILGKLIRTIRTEISNYRVINGMSNQECLISADDMFSALTYIIWKTNRNIHGSCVYVETVLCCEYETVELEALATQLETFNSETRHCFEMVKSVARIGLITEELRDAI